MNKVCRAVRDRIQESLDNRRAVSRRAIPSDVRAHLEDCPECKAFVERWENLVQGLKGALDEEISHLESPDYSLILQKGKAGEARTGSGSDHSEYQHRRSILSRPLRPLLRVAAVVVIIAIAGLSSYVGFSRHQLRSTIRENNRLFIESLFERSIFETGENNQLYVWNGIENGWFEETELTRNIPYAAGESPQAGP